MNAPVFLQVPSLACHAMFSHGALSIRALSRMCIRTRLETAGSNSLKGHCILRFVGLLLQRCFYATRHV